MLAHTIIIICITIVNISTFEGSTFQDFNFVIFSELPQPTMDLTTQLIPPKRPKRYKQLINTPKTLQTIINTKTQKIQIIQLFVNEKNN